MASAGNGLSFRQKIARKINRKRTQGDPELGGEHAEILAAIQIIIVYCEYIEYEGKEKLVDTYSCEERVRSASVAW
jgi:hypothetical protein